MKGISIKYEEEDDDDDESDEELSDKEVGKILISDVTICCLLSQLLGTSGFHSSKFGNIMDAGELRVGLFNSDEEDLSAELRELKECSSSNNSDEDLHLNDRGKLAILIYIYIVVGNLDPKLAIGQLTVSSKVTSAGEQQQSGVRRSQRPTTARGHRTQPTKPQSPKE